MNYDFDVETTEKEKYPYLKWVVPAAFVAMSIFFMKVFPASADTTAGTVNFERYIQSGTQGTGSIVVDITGNTYHTLLKLTTPSDPGGTITGVDLTYSKPAGATTVGNNLCLYSITGSFTTSANWSTYDGTTSWSTPGGDFATEYGCALDTDTPAHFDLTGLITNWSTTYYVGFKYQTESNSGGVMDYIDASIHPTFTITYSTGAPTPTPTPSGTSTSTLSTTDQYQQNIFLGLILYLIGFGGILWTMKLALPSQRG